MSMSVRRRTTMMMMMMMMLLLVVGLVVVVVVVVDYSDSWFLVTMVMVHVKVIEEYGRVYYWHDLNIFELIGCGVTDHVRGDPDMIHACLPPWCLQCQDPFYGILFHIASKCVIVCAFLFKYSSIFQPCFTLEFQQNWTWEFHAIIPAHVWRWDQCCWRQWCRGADRIAVDIAFGSIWLICCRMLIMARGLHCTSCFLYGRRREA